MAKSSRHTSSQKQSKRSSNDAALCRSDSEEEVEIVDEEVPEAKPKKSRNGKGESSVRVSRDSKAGEKRTPWERSRGSEDSAEVELIASKRRREERALEDEVQNSELKREVEKEIRGGKDGSVERGKCRDYLRDDDDGLLSSRAKLVKDRRYKDEGSYKAKCTGDAERSYKEMCGEGVEISYKKYGGDAERSYKKKCGEDVESSYKEKKYGKGAERIYEEKYGEGAERSYEDKNREDAKRNYKETYGEDAKGIYKDKYGEGAERSFKDKYGEAADRNYKVKLVEDADRSYKDKLGEAADRSYRVKLVEDADRIYKDKHGESGGRSIKFKHGEAGGRSSKVKRGEDGDRSYEVEHREDAGRSYKVKHRGEDGDRSFQVTHGKDGDRSYKIRHGDDCDRSYKVKHVEDAGRSYKAAYGEDAGKSYKVKHGEDAERSCKATYGEDAERSYKAAYGEDADTGRSYKVKHGEDADRSYKATYGEDAGRSYKDRCGEDTDRDKRHSGSKSWEDVDWKKRHREERHKDEHSLSNHHGDSSGTKHVRDESNAAESRYKKSRFDISSYDDGQTIRYKGDRGNEANDKEDQNYSRSGITMEHSDAEKKVTASGMVESVADKEGSCCVDAEFGKSGVIKESDASGTEGKGILQLPSETPPTVELSRAYSDFSSSPSHKADQLPSNSWSNFPPPCHRYKRSNSSNVRRIYGNSRNSVSGNARNGVPNRPSPVMKSFTHFHHGPAPVSYHPVMHQFSALPMYGGRPVMDIHCVFPHHIHDADSFLSHDHSFGWQNPIDDSRPPPLHGWGSNNGVARPDSLAYGRLDWNQNRKPIGGQQLETSVEMWKGPHGGVNSELHSVPQEEDEFGFGTSSLQVQSENNQCDVLVDKSHKIESDLSCDALETEPSKPSNDIPKKLLNLSKIPKDDDGRLLLVYLSKLDISAELTYPELYNQCLKLMAVEQAENVGEDSLNLLYLEEVVKTQVELSKLASTASLFVALNDSVFQRAMSFYKKQREETRAIPLPSLSKRQKSSFFSAKNMDFVLNCDQDKQAVTKSPSNETKAGQLYPTCSAPYGNVHESVPVVHLEKSCEPSPSRVLQKVKMIMDMVPNQEASNGCREGNSPTIDHASQSAPGSPDHLSRAGDFRGKNSAGSGEKHKLVDTESDHIPFSNVSDAASEVVMSESVEMGSVNVSRIHGAFEITL